MKSVILFLTALFFSCNQDYVQPSDNPTSPNNSEISNNNESVANTTSNNKTEDSELKKRIKRFYNFSENEFDYTKNEFRNIKEDQKFLKYIFSIPRQKIIRDLVVLQNEDKNDYEIQSKTSYLLIKLKHNEKANQKKLLSTFALYEDKAESKFEKDHILHLISDIIKVNDSDGSFLTEAFDLVNEVDGAYAESFSGMVTDEFKKNPKRFLICLKQKPQEIIDKVISHLFYAERKEILLKSLTSIPKTFDAYDLVREIQIYKNNVN
ncbi:MAG: hypothetical protein K1X72_22965 [Pyrinomonadaceae bacterium]|nr:hypothetical protein [Pyrinomonadaceae bacterium]